MIEKTQVILFGADKVGKTSLLNQMKMNKNVTSTFTISFNVEGIQYKDKIIALFDVSGEEKSRALWETYMEGISCIIYILNLADKEKLNTYIECFNLTLEINKKHGNVPIIIFGNKFNDKLEFEPEEMLKNSNLSPEISSYILKGNVATGEGISQLLEYIYNNFKFKEETIEEKEDKKEQKEKNEENKEYKLVMLGLGKSGKTSILHLLKYGKEVMTTPTIGFNEETIDNYDKKIKILDLGGGQENLWSNYLDGVNGLIWVYDLSDNKSYEESHNELKKLLSHPKISQDIPLLIFANKSDLNKDGNKPSDFYDRFQGTLKGRTFFIKECNKNDLNSYKKGIDFLYQNINY